MVLGRPLIIAAQVVVVAALSVLVYVNFLQPEDEGPVSGIEAPPGTERQADSNAAGPGEGNGDAGRRAAPGGPGPVGTLASIGETAPAQVAGPSTPLAPDSPGPTGQGPDAGGPAGDQYRDAVARLTIRLYGD